MLRNRHILTIAVSLGAMLSLSYPTELLAQASATPSPTIGDVGAAYRINPGDELEVAVWGEERLTKSIRVLPDGTFSYPLVGQVNAAGLLPSELEKIITAGLSPQYRGSVPQVTVIVSNPSGYQFTVVGKVRSPGTFTPGRYVNALEAVTIAGGPSEFAKVGRIRILRKVGQELRTIIVRIGQALKGKSGRIGQIENPSLQSGDTIIVP